MPLNTIIVKNLANEVVKTFHRESCQTEASFVASTKRGVCRMGAILLTSQRNGDTAEYLVQLPQTQREIMLVGPGEEVFPPFCISSDVPDEEIIEQIDEFLFPDGFEVKFLCCDDYCMVGPRQ